MKVALSGIAGITLNERKAFEKFLQYLVKMGVNSEQSFSDAVDEHREIMKHKGENFDAMMKEVALWMKQCTPSGGKKWEAGNEPFACKAGFDLFFKYAPEEIKTILKSGGQPLLNTFSDKLSKDVYASLKTINQEEYEKLVKKVDPDEIMQVYRECGFSRMGGEEDEDYINRCIGLDYRNAFDDDSLAFNIENLLNAPEVHASFDRGFELYVYYNDMSLGGVEAPESALNEISLKAMIKTILKEEGINSEVEFLNSQDKIDEKTFDLSFKLLNPPADSDAEGLASLVLTKPDMYKEVLPATAAAEVVAEAMSLKQKLDFMFSEAYPKIKAYTKDGRDCVNIEIEAGDTKCEFKAYKDGELLSEGCDTNFDPLLKKGLVFSMKELLKQRETWAEIKISDQDINKLSSLVSQMEPENLYMDGEISVKEGEKRLKELKKEWEALEKKIGRKVTPQEVFDWENESNAAVNKKLSDMVKKGDKVLEIETGAIVEIGDKTSKHINVIYSKTPDNVSFTSMAVKNFNLKFKAIATAAPKMEDLERVELYPTAKDMNVEAILTKMNREDGSSYYGIRAVDYMKKGGKNLGHSLITYPSLEAAKKIFDGIKNRVPKAKN